MRKTQNRVLKEAEECSLCGLKKNDNIGRGGEAGGSLGEELQMLEGKLGGQLSQTKPVCWCRAQASCQELLLCSNSQASAALEMLFAPIS